MTAIMLITISPYSLQKDFAETGKKISPTLGSEIHLMVYDLDGGRKLDVCCVSPPIA